MTTSFTQVWSTLKEHRVDLAIVVGLAALAAIPRLLFLEALPDGLHNDESWTGLDAQRILDGTLKSPYTDVTGGQPTGPLYSSRSSWRSSITLFSLFDSRWPSLGLPPYRSRT
jgi:hypothetical protein